MEEAKITSPLKAIRAWCLYCSNDSAYEVKLCADKTCPLYEFRLGHNPYRKKREYTEEERAALAERLKNAREAQK